MLKSYRAFRFQTAFSNRFTVILLLIILANLLIITAIRLFIEARGAGMDMVAGQIDGQAYAMIFILGLLSFKTSFRFMLANGFTRRLYFRANLAALAAVSAGWALIVVILAAITKTFLPYKMVPELIYREAGAAGIGLWLAATLFFLAALGWFINLSYYRSGGRVKLLISVAPIVVMALIGYVDLRIGGAISRALGHFLLAVLGLGGASPDPYLGALSLLAGAAILCGGCYLLVRRAPIKD